VNKLVLVDEHDNIIGTEEKMVVHQLGMLHRAFSIFIFRKQQGVLQVLLQKRQRNKYHSGGLWTNSCCGHPGINEEIIFAGNRRLQEELGIDIPLHYLDNFIYKSEFTNNLTEHELDHVLVGIYKEHYIKLDPNEVDDIKWSDLPELEQELLAFPENFTVWLPLAWSIVKNNLSFINTLFK
jgi:isopentenyl-diphosphate delta-isomerase type 1